MKRITKLVSLLIALAMLLSMLPMAALAEDISATTDTVLYLRPNSNWTQASARFAAYLYSSDYIWLDAVAVEGEEDLYSVTVPADYVGWTIIFCRMNPSTTENSWDNKWNQTGDLTWPTNGSNLFTVKDGTWDGATVTWSYYSTECSHEYETDTVGPTCTSEGYTTYTCTLCGNSYNDDYVTMVDHAYGDDNICDTCGFEASFNSIYFINSNGWSEVYVHGWSDSAATTWPGIQMTLTGDTVNGYDVYSVTFEVDYTDILFHNNAGSQTTDMAIMIGSYYNPADDGWYPDLESIPTVDPLATTYTLNGGWNEWAGNAFTRKEEGSSYAYVELELDAATTYEFKIVANGTWLGCAATITGDVADYGFYSYESTNCAITTTTAGVYTFAVNMDDNTLSITYPGCSHANTTTTTVAATCTEDGSETVTCDDCGETVSTTVIPAAHTYKDNCDSDCNVCGEYRWDAPHNLTTYVEAKIPANCQEEGYRDYWICADCGGYFTDEYASSQLNPSWIYYNGDHVRPEGSADCAIVTCELCGEDSYGTAVCVRPEGDPVCQVSTCVNCGDTIYAEAHSYGYDENGNSLTPLCQSDTCVYCKQTLDYIYECENNVYATCAYDGECVYGCGKLYPATGIHELDDACVGGTCWMCWKEIDPTHANTTTTTVAATCTEDGSETVTCDDCGATVSTTVIPAAHTYSDNCDSDCDACGEWRWDAPHNLTTYVEAKIPANCQEEGYSEYWICADCGGYFSDENASSQLNPAWIYYTGDHVRPEGSADCAIVTCELCGEDSYGTAVCVRPEGDPVCQVSTCVNCGDTIYAEAHSYGYDEDSNSLTPLCQSGTCIYCEQTLDYIYECENNVYATCAYDGECVYGCGKQYPATGEHSIDDACAGGTCWMCWQEIAPAHEYFYPCDAYCMNCYELTNEDAAHSVVHVDAVEATCEATGNVEYWYCEYCGGCWLDEALTQVTNRMSIITFKDHEYFYACDAYCMNCYELTNEDAAHTVVHVDAVEATCSTFGNVEYWYCSDCGGCWLDESLMRTTNRRSVTTYLDHSYVAGVCEYCGEADPDYVPNPEKVENLTASDITTVSFTLTWDEAANATKYWIWIDGAVYTSTTGTSISIAYRDADTAYAVAVTALMEDGTVLSLENADTIEVTTASVDTTFSCTSTYNSITVSWNNAATKAWIYIGTDAADLKPVASTTGTSATVTGLQSGVSYYISVVYLVDGKLVNASDVAEVTTETNEDLSVTLDGNTLSWNEVDGSYKYWIYVDGQILCSTTETSYTFESDVSDAVITVKGYNGNIIFDYYATGDIAGEL